jgi:hypothetical protein
LHIDRDMTSNQIASISLSDLATVSGGQAAEAAAPAPAPAATEEMMPRREAARWLTACGVNAYNAGVAASAGGDAAASARKAAIDACNAGVAGLTK